jgi:hypothetical protein
VETPVQAGSLWGSTPPAKGPWGRELQRIRAEAQQQAQQRRARVLAHDWARARLCELFGYKAAEQWNGYVPPRADPAPDRGAQLARPNTAPQRAALVQLLRDVAHFDTTGEMPVKLEAVELPLAEVD